MLRLVSKRLGTAAMLSLALSTAALHADPVVRLTIASPHDLDTFVGDFAKLGEKPEKAAAARDVFVKTGVYDGAGIDTTKRIGLVLNVKEGAPPAPTIIIAVADETKFLAAFKPFYPQQDKLPDGRWKLMSDKTPPLAVRVDKGFAFVNILSEAEVPPPAEPAKALEGRGTIDLNVSVTALPEPMKAQILNGIKQGGEQKAAAMASEAEKAQARAGTQSMVTAMEKFFAQTDSLDFVLGLSTSEIRLDFEMKTKAGVPALTAAPGAPIGLSKLVPANAAVGFTSDMSLDEIARNAMKESAKNGFEAARKQGGPPEKLKFIDAMEVEVNNLVSTGRVEGVALVDGKKGAANLVFAVRTAPDSKINDALKAALEAESKKPGNLKPTVTTDGALTLYTADTKQKSMAADLGGSEFTVGIRPGLVSLVLGAKPVERIKSFVAALDAGKPDAAGTIGSAKGWFGLRAFADIAGISTFAKNKTDEELFTKYVTTGADQVGFSLEPQSNGYKSSLFVQGGLVALLARSMMKDPGAAPAPAQDAAPAVEASPAPEASAAPEAPASPESGGTEVAPTSETTPSPAADGEEKEEKEEKKEE